MPPGLQSRLGFVNSGAGGFDSHALPPNLVSERATQLVPPPPDVTLREARGTDEALLRAALDQAFRAVDRHHLPRSREEQVWRVRSKPEGSRSILALDRAGSVLAQFASWPRRARVGQEEIWTSHAFDSFADPQAQRGLCRATLFEHVVAEYVARHTGTHGRRDRFSWGLPVRPAWRIGHARLGYELMDPVWSLWARDLTVGPRAEGIDVSWIESAGELDASYDHLFARVAAEREAILVREPEWLAWRWFDRPGSRARLLAAQRASRLVGWAVWMPGDWAGTSGSILADWMLPADETAAGAALLEAVFEEAREAGALPLRAVFPAHAPEFVEFQERGFRVVPATHLAAGRSFDRRRPIDWWSKHLWWTLGDTDLC